MTAADESITIRCAHAEQRQSRRRSPAALGAQRTHVIGLILRQAMTPVAAGIVVGVAGALAFGSVVASLLFDIQPSDPAVISGVIVVVASTGLATCAWAARRGLSIEPMAALREE